MKPCVTWIVISLFIFEYRNTIESFTKSDKLPTYPMSQKKTTTEISASHQATNREWKKRKIVVILENVRSGLNVGNVFRSCDAFGIEKIYCIGYTVSPPHREVLKSAIGATESVLWESQDSIVAVIKELRQSGYRICSIEQTAHSLPLHQVRIENQPVAIILGNEVEGVSEDAIANSDVVIELPQLGMKHSLNVSVCAGIVMFHLQFGHPGE
jgi:23S rRNA (guanosine2251-2'-O)-methyltransferase